MELLFLAILIVLMAGALASGYPVAFALPGSAILSVLLAAACGYMFAGDVDAYFAQGGPTDWLSSGVTNFRGIYWEVERDTLIAIPLFVFMGIMLQRSKIAEDLLVAMAQLFGPVPGGLGISVIFVGALLAATTGILGATVVAMGLISLPAMLRNNYSPTLATGAIAASGTLGQIIPPSIVLIILADQLASAVDQAGTARQVLYKEATGEFSMPSEFGVVSTSAGEMFLGALVPGLVLVGLYMVFVLILGLFRPSMAPSVPFDGKMNSRFFLRVGFILIPPLTLIFAVLGSIITGVATVNQAGAIGAVGAMIMAGYRLREGEPRALLPAILAVASLIAIFVVTNTFEINIKNIKSETDMLGIVLALVAVLVFVFALLWSGWRTYVIDDTLRGVMIETAKTTSLVFIILLGAAMLTAAFRAFGGEELVKEFLTSLPGGFWAQFIIVMAVIFVLGFFLDFIEIAVVVVPIVAPILLMDPSANITAVWLGVMIGLNIQTSFLTPPFGFALFYLRGVAPAAVRTIQMYKGVVPFIALQLLALVIVGNIPALVNYLPTRNLLTSPTAPPPRNPSMQLCIEEYNFGRFASEENAIKSAIESAKKLDISYLPKRLKRDLERGLKSAEDVFPAVETVKASASAVAAKVPEYRPLHRQVRAIQKRASSERRHIAELQRAKTLARGDEALRADIDRRIAMIQENIEKIESEIPDQWPEENKAFVALKRAETNARRKYRRAVDGAYSPVQEVVKAIDGTATLADLEDELRGLQKVIDDEKPRTAAEKISEVSRAVRVVEGTSDVRSALSRVRRELRRRTPDASKAKVELEKAIALYEAQMEWRQRAERDLLPGLKAYEAGIRETIGLRQLPRLPREQALYVAACRSGHKDISLNF